MAASILKICKLFFEQFIDRDFECNSLKVLKLRH